MKKANICQLSLYVALSFWLLVVNISSAKQNYSYQIQFASNSINHWEIKNSILETYDAMTQRVKEEFYYEIISQGIKEFEPLEDSEAKLVNHQIVIIIGDGKGIMVEGVFAKTCQVPIKKKSLILTLLGNGN